MYRHVESLEGSNWFVLKVEIDMIRQYCNPSDNCWMYTAELISVSGESCSSQPHEVHICGENKIQLADKEYENKKLDHRYVRMYDNYKRRFYYGLSVYSSDFYLWYEPSRFNWMVSTEKFNANTTLMYRHKIDIVGSDWFVLGNLGTGFRFTANCKLNH